MQTLTAEFLGKEITLVDNNGVAYVAMREVVEGDWVGVEAAISKANGSQSKIQLLPYDHNWKRRQKIRNALYAN